MSALIDDAQRHSAVDNRPIPTLEAMVANDQLRSSRQFDHGGFPFDLLAAESRAFLDARPMSRQRKAPPMPEELRAIMERPLDEDELMFCSFNWSEFLSPDDIYYREAKREYRRVNGMFKRPTPEIFQGLDGVRRQGVITRHLVKRRWEKLGIWNPRWGFAGRKSKPEDDSSGWAWCWDPKRPTEMMNKEIIERVLRLRQNLRRGEYVPVAPHSLPGPDTTPAEAEAFLITRPWFIFQIEVGEELTRYRRLDVNDQIRYAHSARKQVIQWWKERGHWKDEFDRVGRVTSWTWQHESRSPELEDLTPMSNMKGTILDAAAEMDFTPSEVDELETIDLPTSEQPEEGFWLIGENDWRPRFPGEVLDLEAKSRKEAKENLKKLKAEGREPVISQSPDWVWKVFGEGALTKHEDASIEEREPPNEIQADAAEADTGVSALPPSPRRSARIAALKRPVEP